MRILAVDDDDVILQLLNGALDVSGFSDNETANGPEKALALIESAAPPFDCFLLDIQMPVMTGIELCARIRKIPRHRKTPIIMLTAMSDRDYIDRAFIAGATDYVTKPFDILQLGTRVRLAERIHLEIQEAIKAKSSLDSIVESLQDNQQFPLSDAIIVDDVDRFLSLPAFENYVSTLGRGNFYSLDIFALEITNIEAINIHCSSKDFVFAITDFAEAISDCMVTNNGFSTYTGSGIFVCTYNRVRENLSDDFAQRVLHQIYQMNLCYDDQTPMDVRIRCGNTISPGVFSKPGSASVIKRAMKSLRQTPIANQIDLLKPASTGLHSRFAQRFNLF